MNVEARCSLCQTPATLVCSGERPIHEQLLEKTCKQCHRRGALLHVRTLPEPEAVGPGDPPDDIGDEQLVDRRVRHSERRF